MSDDTITSRSHLSVNGMTCAACANRIQRGLSKLGGVEDARVNFASRRATVFHDDTVSDDEFRTTIKQLGYFVVTNSLRLRRFAGYRTDQAQPIDPATEPTTTEQKAVTA